MQSSRKFPLAAKEQDTQNASNALDTTVLLQKDQLLNRFFVQVVQDLVWFHQTVSDATDLPSRLGPFAGKEKEGQTKNRQ